MPRCAGMKRDGGRCATIVGPSQSYCYQHDPARAAERSRNASHAARSKPDKELRDVKASLKDLAAGVLEGRVDRGDAAVVGQLYGQVLRAVSLEMKVREQLELASRIEALEQASEQTKGGRAWRGA